MRDRGDVVSSAGTSCVSYCRSSLYETLELNIEGHLKHDKAPLAPSPKPLSSPTYRATPASAKRVSSPVAKSESNGKKDKPVEAQPAESNWVALKELSFKKSKCSSAYRSIYSYHGNLLVIGVPQQQPGKARRSPTPSLQERRRRKLGIAARQRKMLGLRLYEP